ncbi:Hypothetical predicted protein [Pelobates cultripes]|uniref:Uncharacterized protein n=1 Tax=Pelobates cultripes TaxID=61616 RepID=A0AAD1S5Y1_PELCU|nr:Hypothetical predicted protein [Pelobates cultripes]
MHPITKLLQTAGPTYRWSTPRSLLVVKEMKTYKASDPADGPALLAALGLSMQGLPTPGLSSAHPRNNVDIPTFVTREERSPAT